MVGSTTKRRSATPAASSRRSGKATSASPKEQQPSTEEPYHLSMSEENTNGHSNGSANGTRSERLHSPSPTTGIASVLPDLQLTLPTLSEPDFIDFIYKPHTIMTGFMGFFTVFGLIILWQTYQVSQIKAGMWAALCAFILFGMVYLPDNSLVRPHPAIWRGLLALAVAYMVLMVFFVGLDLETTKYVFGLYDAQLKEPLPEQSYAEDCRVWVPEDPGRPLRQIFDVFILAHAMGFVVKMLVIRDWRIVLLLSLMFEVIEVSGQHLLPNFKECWWDHLIADVLVCNALGTYVGYLLLKYFRAKKYRWSKLQDIPTFTGKTKRVVAQFLPREPLKQYSWPVFYNFKNWLCGNLLCLVMLTEEVNCFTMKSILNMSPSHHLVAGRIIMYGFFAVPGLRQFHDYAFDPRCTRLGAMAWVGATALTFETVWILGMIYEGGYFRDPWPAHVSLPWFYSIAAYVLWATLFFNFPKQREAWKPFLNFLFYSIPVALFALCCMGNLDMRWGQVTFDTWAYNLGLWGPVLPPA